MKILIRILLSLILLPPAVWLTIIVLNIHLPLAGLAAPLSVAVSYALQREVHFDGEINLAPTLLPTLEITDVRIANPEAGTGDLLTLGRVYLEMNLVDLLERKVTIQEFSASNVTLELESYADGTGNWMLDPLDHTVVDAPSGDADGLIIDLGDGEGLRIQADIRHVALDELHISYRDFGRDLQLDFHLAMLSGKIGWADEIRLQGIGRYQAQPWTVRVRGDSLESLLNSSSSWDGGAEIDLSGMELSYQLALRAGGERITSLQLNSQNLAEFAPVAGVDLPPWGPFSLAGKLIRTDDAHALRDLEIGLGDSRLSGSLDLSFRDGIPDIQLELASSHLQLDDFELDSFAEAQPGEADGEELVGAATSEKVDWRQWFAQEQLTNQRLQIDVAVDEVVAGEDRLGAGEFRFRIEGNRAEFERVRVEVPGGEATFSGAITSNSDHYDVDLTLGLENFDYGVLARREDPETDLQGQLYLNLELSSSSPQLRNLLAYGDGHLDIAVWPEKFEAGVFDLWAVGLLSAALNQYQSDSVVNCVVTRFELEQGVMREKSLMIDTSKMRVLGDAVVDFGEETVDMYLVPKSKSPQFVSLATPVQLVGRFEDFEPKIQNSDIAGSVVRSGLNIFLWGIPLLFHENLPEDGTPDCRRAMEEDMRLERRKK